MKIIQKKYYKAEQILGQQETTDDLKKRFITYTIATPCKDGILLHNVMTKEMILLENEELDLININDLNASAVLRKHDTELFNYLFKNWYIVSISYDDKSLCLNLRAVVRQLQEVKLAGKLHSFTILTTTDCNARCFYCYEKGAKKENMTKETALKVVDFIKRSSGGEKVHISWFGGEPLYNLEPIDIITSGLKKEGIKYVSKMITNGYLFDEDLISKATNKWHLSRVQITLDGTEEVYNKRKAYIYKDVNAFKRVTSNIENLLKAGISVIIRLNLDINNYDDLLLLADYLHERYGKYDKFYAYAQYLKNEKQGCPFNGEAYTLDKYRIILNEHLERNRKNFRLSSNISIYKCMADGPSAVLIQTNGDLGKCEHYFNSHSCGTIEKGICNFEEVARFKEADTYIEACDNCPIYPNCIRIAMCPSSFLNSKENSLVECPGKIDHIKREMLSTYRLKTNKH